MFDRLKEQWKSKDKVAKVLGMFSGPRLYEDWQIALPDENNRDDATWDIFKTTMEGFYKPSENVTLNNYQFRSLSQHDDESFASYCVRVEKESKACTFKCQHLDCTAESIAVRDQIIIGTTSGKIREEALLKSWNLGALRTEGIKLESAYRGEAEISGGAVNRIRKYSFSNLKNRKTTNTGGISCFNCGELFSGPSFKHNASCKARSHKCKLCAKIGHLPKCCHSQKSNLMKLTRKKRRN